MFGRKKEGKKERPVKSRAGMRQLGLLDMDGYYNVDPQTGAVASPDGDDEDDVGLEEELLAITSGKAPARPKRTPRAPVNLEELDSMIQQSLQDVASDVDDGSDLENDSELLAELQQLTPEDTQPPEPPPKPSPRRPPPPIPTTEQEQPVTSSAPPLEPPSLEQRLEQRLKMYQNAKEAAAGDSAKIRRLDRGIKTLNNLIKLVKAGKTIDESGIPPEVGVGIAKKVPPPIIAPPDEEIKLAEPSPPSDPMIDLLQWAEALTQPMPSAPSPSTPSPSTSPPTSSAVSPPPSPKKLRESPPPPKPRLPTPEDDEEKAKKAIFDMLGQRKKQYQLAAVSAKKSGDIATAMKYIKIAKQFEVVIVALQQGQPIDLSQMPPPPPGFTEETGADFPTPPSSLSSSTPSVSLDFSTSEQSPPLPVADEPQDPALFKAPPPPSSILEALEQRRDKYQATMKEAQEQANPSKSRRMGRIVKQYEDAIKAYKAGKQVPYDELPDPPGFAPIPREGGPAPVKTGPVSGQASGVSQATNGQGSGQMTTGQVGPSASPSSAALPKPSPGKAEGGPSRVAPSPPGGAAAGPSKAAAAAAAHGAKAGGRQEKQLMTLQERQKLFRDAALEAKKKGDIEAAKEYLRISKGFNPMIEASKCGMPVNLDTAPLPPQMKRKKELETESEGFEVIEMSDCLPQGDREEMYEKLEADLKSQIAMCTKNREHFTQLGDINHARKFQLLMEHANKDLMCLKYASKRGDPVPRFHYELKTFNIVQCFTELNDNECELTIVRGINYSCPNPKEIDTFVRFEFPFPSENSPKDKTSTVKNTNNPEYNQTFMLSINRKARSIARVFKRYAVKCEVMSKGGFFHSDACLGTVQVKLAPLEAKCYIHDTFDLMDGRKAIGGKLEVKIRIREPLAQRQVEQIKEKWLVIDSYGMK